MCPKAQHGLAYRKLPTFLRTMREKAGLTQRQLGLLLKKPQSWIYNCEVANRRVDVTEFIVWSRACQVDPKEAFQRLVEEE